MNKQILIVILFFLYLPTQAKSELTLTIQAGEFDRLECIVSASLSGYEIDEHSISFFEKTKRKKIKTPYQLLKEENGAMRIYWKLSGNTASKTSRTFVLEHTRKGESQEKVMSVEDTGDALVVKKNGKSVLQYNYTFTNPPEGVDKIFGRSGYIHPAYSPAGNILTRIQPIDHYHHYGIWNPWTRIEYDEQMYDLWNLGDKKGTVKSEKIETIHQGPIFSGYDAQLGHYIFTSMGDKKIMNEWWKIKTWNCDEGFLWDFESHLLPSTSLPVLLKEYRYAGFSYRATEEWTRHNSEMFTSEGKTRQQIDGTNALWIYVAGQTITGRSGILFLGHPQNYNSPEPLRIWNENANGNRGDAFINFAPTKDKDWLLEPNNTYILRYRVLSFEGEMTKEEADRLWHDFAYPPVIEIKTK